MTAEASKALLKEQKENFAESRSYPRGSKEYSPKYETGVYWINLLGHIKIPLLSIL